jgi:hypothetical protein
MQQMGPGFESQAVQEDGTDRLPQNFGNCVTSQKKDDLSHTAAEAWHPVARCYSGGASGRDT